MQFANAAALQIAALKAELERYRAPRSDKGTYETSICIAGIEAVLIAHYEVLPEEGDGWNSPHRPEEIQVLAVYLHGTDIGPALSEAQLEEIASRISQEVADNKEADAEDRAEARTEALKEAA
ncbi:hypothetical protein PSQ40_04750 [Curvibacter sp. HBC61]|uniref:Phage protein n=1 Tax=Curvibacter cyanobacteriorum TaxID=3026422 RepID=A0ABT5MUZ0_9BURK|nr:hypothetical protein [Curvibacter sp. HBC61]MDD0837874.1 hypothetical protein [Curvibacter sp. HBC61]